jgi:cell wall-associated NlpC family hydrolase
MAKTAKGLVDYCKAQLGKPYWYGTFGDIATESLYKNKKEQYPEYYDRSQYKQGWSHQYGQRVHDCVGLIKGYLWSANATAKPKYKSSQDVSANGMLKVCKEKGKISTIPEVPGVLVFYGGHVGIYIGGGYVIEARGHDYGVVKTRLEDRNWVNWGKCPWIKYPSGNYFIACDPKATSIVDALKEAGEKSDILTRRKIAIANGIKDYTGTAKQNIQLLNLMKQGKLMKP